MRLGTVYLGIHSQSCDSRGSNVRGILSGAGGGVNGDEIETGAVWIVNKREISVGGPTLAHTPPQGKGTCWPVLFLSQLSLRKLVPKRPDMPKPPDRQFGWQVSRAVPAKAALNRSENR